ncbi:hypothetical protein G3580_18040 [Nitrogeniibacter mangrovi]|uniref:Uncharacterized protein n=1 Tax=Nitrogeniibacter mangrovi TaxID=2016596 RepID=A0A6C1B828_9RHOO|nr:hypothetical protein G3580_18040 [Nitrogeniibacter mangrovi]
MQETDDPVVIRVFGALLNAMKLGGPFDLSLLDRLSFADFTLAVDSIRVWRTQRYVLDQDRPSAAAPARAT